MPFRSCRFFPTGLAVICFSKSVRWHAQEQPSNFATAAVTDIPLYIHDTMPAVFPVDIYGTYHVDIYHFAGCCAYVTSTYQHIKTWEAQCVCMYICILLHNLFRLTLPLTRLWIRNRWMMTRIACVWRSACSAPYFRRTTTLENTLHRIRSDVWSITIDAESEKHKRQSTKSSRIFHMIAAIIRASKKSVALFCPPPSMGTVGTVIKNLLALKRDGPCLKTSAQSPPKFT